MTLLPKTVSLRAAARVLAAKTSDAYSVGRYAPGAWEATLTMLLRRGYTEEAAAAIARSKWTRWAADASGAEYGRATSADVARFLDDPRNDCTPREVARFLEPGQKVWQECVERPEPSRATKAPSKPNAHEALVDAVLSGNFQTAIDLALALRGQP